MPCSTTCVATGAPCSCRPTCCRRWSACAIASACCGPGGWRSGRPWPGGRTWRPGAGRGGSAGAGGAPGGGGPPVKPALTLVVHSAARARWLIGGFGLLLLVFQVLFVLLAVTLQESNTFGRIAEIAPPFVRELLGSSFVTMISFSGVVGLGYFHPLILAAPG